MIEMATTATVAGPQPLNELLNLAHDRPFSLLFGNYSWLLGMAGGLALIWAFNELRRDKPPDSDLQYQLAMPLCVVFILTGFLNVLAEVKQPSRLIYGYIQGWAYWDTAIIKYGIILLPVFLATSWWLSFQCLDRAALDRGIRAMPLKLVPVADFVTLWSRHYYFGDYPILRRIVITATIIFGFFAPLYSAVFLMYEHGVPVWNSPAQALIFLATGLAKGAAILLVLAPALYRLATGKRIRPAASMLRWLAVCGLGVAAVTWFGWMWWVSRLGTLPDQQFSALISGPYRSLVFWHWELVGLLIPLAVLLSPLGRSRVLRWIASLAIIWGSYAIRVIVLLGGQALNRSGAGYLTFELEPEVAWYSGFSLLFLIGMLALLLLLPYGRAGSFENRRVEVEP